VGIEDTWGTYVWHVKQSNNGTSWIASRSPLEFARLKSQNEYFPWDTHVRVSIVYDDSLNLKNRAESISYDLDRRLQAVSGIADPVVQEIREELLAAAQGELISHLHEFLDDCYLRILMEVLQSGNQSKLALDRFKVNLNPARYTPLDYEESSGSDQRDAMNWFTIQGLISDIWRTYKFEAFKDKIGMLFRACDYKVNDELQRELAKHVLLRNCIQHHQRQLTADALQAAGLKEFVLLGSDQEKLKIGPGGRIYFSVEEIKALSRRLVELAAGFDSHVGKRVRSVGWIPKESPPNT
jgi:hypothetical protein